MKLPLEHRPNVKYKECALGVDLSAWFIHDLQGLDSHLYPVFHAFNVLWDAGPMNQYEGTDENPKYNIHYAHGELNFGLVLTDGKGAPQYSGKWHIWRLAKDRGWVHIIPLESKNPEYLNLVIRRMYLQDKFIQKYGGIAFNKMLRDQEESLRDGQRAAYTEWFNAVQDENKFFIKQAAENYMRGHIEPTNPQKETISSWSGQGHRSRLTRPLEDEDVLKVVWLQDPVKKDLVHDPRILLI